MSKRRSLDQALSPQEEAFLEEKKSLCPATVTFPHPATVIFPHDLG